MTLNTRRIRSALGPEIECSPAIAAEIDLLWRPTHRDVRLQFHRTYSYADMNVTHVPRKFKDFLTKFLSIFLNVVYPFL